MLLALVLFTTLVGQTYAAVASCELRKHNDGTVIGRATFVSSPGSLQRVTVRVSDPDLADGLHGFHIHQKGVSGYDCLTTGGHYNPDGVDHGAAGGPASSRHVGDFGNVNSASGEIDGNLVYFHGMKLFDRDDVYFVSEDRFELSGERSIIGRAAVLHAGTDDLGKGGDEGSRKTGNAGPRWACCTLTLA